MIVIGVDPGLDGAIACLNEHGDLVAIHDVPTIWTTVAKKKRRRRYDEDAIVDVVDGYLRSGDRAHAVIEEQQAFPGRKEKLVCQCGRTHDVMRPQGVTSTMSIGRGMGIWQGLFAARRVPRYYVRPRTWKSKMIVGMDAGDKASSLLTARRRFPNADLGKAKHQGRAEAILIAMYGLMELVPRPIAEEKRASIGGVV